MRGLAYIRRRCNITERELADQLHVTRQAISMWESGKKEIPAERKIQLARFFGIDAQYLEEITEEDKNYIINKAMFRRDIDGKEAYCYVPDGKDRVGCTFFSDREHTLDEEYTLAIRRRNEALDRVQKFITGPETQFLEDKAMQIQNGCDRIEFVIDLFDMVMEKERFLKVPFRIELMNIMRAMKVANGRLPMEEYLDCLRKYENIPQDIEFFLKLVDLFGEHWKKEEKRIKNEYTQKRKQIGQISAADNRPLEERVAEKEKEVREDKVLESYSLLYVIV